MKELEDLNLGGVTVVIGETDEYSEYKNVEMLCLSKKNMWRLLTEKAGTAYGKGMREYGIMMTKDWNCVSPPRAI